MKLNLLYILILILPIGCALKSPQAIANSQIKSKSGLSWIDQSKNKKKILRRDLLPQIEELAKTKSFKGSMLALFSYGGWSDVGQRVHFFDKNSAHENYFYAKPNSSKFESQNKASSQLTESLEQLSEGAKNLSNYESGAFDGVQFELMIAEFQEDTWKITHRINMNNPEIGVAGKIHNETVKSFIKISDSLLKKK